MNFTQLGSSVARLLRQVPGVNGLYTCADLSAVINDANLDTCKDTNALQDYGEVYTVSGTYQYALSAATTAPNYLSILKVYWAGKPLVKVPFGDARWSSGATKNSGDPSVYRVWNGLLEVDPTPDTAQPLNVYFTYKPATLVDSTATLELPTEYHMAVVYKALSYLTIRDEKEGRVNAFLQKYYNELSRLRALQTGLDTEQIPLDPYTASALTNNNGGY